LVTSLFDESVLRLINLESPDRFTWLQAEKICQSGHEKSGFPSMYDSIYHAMAIVRGGTFFTADKRHYAKSKKFGHIALLEDWEEALHTI
jgi:N-acetylneuraminic acid mutarotase